MQAENGKKTLIQQAEENRKAGLEIDFSEVARITREVGPKGGRQQTILNGIDNALNTILEIGVTDAELREKNTLEDGDESIFDADAYKKARTQAIKDGYFITKRELALVHILGSLSQICREEWTFS